MKNTQLKHKEQEAASDRDPRIEDIELRGSYSVLEIATLAAQCGGDTAPDRIEAAIQLLSATEWSAFLGKRARYRQRLLKAGHPGWESPEQFSALVEQREKGRRNCQRAMDICREAECDPETGKILRKSLVSLAYQSAGIGEADSEHALRLFNDWLKIESADVAKGIASEAVHRMAGSPPIDLRNFTMWTDEEFLQFEELSKSPKTRESALVVTKSIIESAHKSPLIHDEETAYELTRGFLRFLENRQITKKSKIVRSQKVGSEGQIVSPKTRGAERGIDGKYT